MTPSRFRERKRQEQGPAPKTERSADLIEARKVIAAASVGQARDGAALNGATPPGAEGRSPEAPQPQTINGVAETPSKAPSNQAPQGPTAQEVAFALTFTRIVSVLMHSVHYRHYSLSDLEWLVVPPILTGQCAVWRWKQR